jgi:hypothetical protein
MTPIKTSLALALVVGPALALAPTSPATAASSAAAASGASVRCASVADIGPTGADPADAVSLRAKGATCRTARSVARAWGPATVRQTGSTITVGRYRCTDTTASRVTVRCTARGGRVISWKLG